MSHPENDLHSDADRFSRVRAPQSFDELADEPDPLLVAQRNKRSTWEAIRLAVVTVVGTLAISQLLKWILGEGMWWAVLASIPPVVGLLACAVIMVRKLNRYERWIPWMGVFWLPLVPFTMWWLTITIGYIALQTSQ